MWRKVRTWKSRPENVRPLNLNGNVTMGGMVVPRASTHKHLGVTLNSSLTWQDHVNNVYTACARKVGILQRLRRLLSSEALRRIYLGAIRPKMEYACAVWSGGPTKNLVRLQDKFCRQHRISLPPLERRFQYQTLVLFFKLRSQLTPDYLTSILPSIPASSGYNFRKSSYPVPFVNTKASLNSFLPRAVIFLERTISQNPKKYVTPCIKDPIETAPTTFQVLSKFFCFSYLTETGT